jgi:hypothetical protein
MAEIARSADSLAHFVAVYLEGKRFLIPQQDLRTLEPLADVDTAVAMPGAVGAIAFKGEALPVYGLPASLDGLHEQPDAGRICAILDAGTERFGLLCAEAVLLPAGNLDIKPVPAAMQRVGSALQGLAIHDGDVVCVTSAAALLGTINGLQSATVPVER